jgi:hypothetical protein
LNRAAENPVDGEVAGYLPAELESLADAFFRQHSKVRRLARQDRMPGGVADEQGGAGSKIAFIQVINGI